MATSQQSPGLATRRRDRREATLRSLRRRASTSSTSRPAACASGRCATSTSRSRPGEFVGLVGESGCGKSTLGFALTRMLRPPARLQSGEIFFDGKDISLLDGEDLRRQRRGGFALVLQSGMNALNPVADGRSPFRRHSQGAQGRGRDTGAAPRSAAAAASCSTRCNWTPSVLDRYPHELSGGMRQRVSIALALSLQPRMIIFDEPTTALDVIVQKAVMQTIKDLQREDGFTAILISHDLGVVLEATDRVMVMYAGEIVEDQPSRSLVTGAHHPYTEALLRLLCRSARRRDPPRWHSPAPRPTSRCRWPVVRSRRVARSPKTSAARRIRH